MKKYALFFSYIFHPLMLPTYTFILLIRFNPFQFAGMPPGEIGKLVIMVFINTFIFPVITTLLMKQLKFIESIHLENQKERLLPYIATMVFFIWSFMVFKKMQVPQVLALSLLGATISVFASFFLNIFFKISMHTVGMGCFIAMTLLATFMSNYNLQIPLIFVILIAGIVGTSRMSLQAHRPFEIYGGYVVGFICQFVAYKFM